jgi:hypothetical protein
MVHHLMIIGEGCAVMAALGEFTGDKGVGLAVFNF